MSADSGYAIICAPVRRLNQQAQPYRCAISIAILCLFCASVRAEQTLVVHEWGTFTCLQDEHGKAIGGINIEDTPVAESLHKIAAGSLLPVGEGGETTADAARCHAQVTMRLEKAVVNFYPTGELRSPTAVRVEVRSHDGWLTQFFPEAEVRSPEFSRDHIGVIGLGLMSTLEWEDMVVHPAGDDPPSAPNSSHEEAGAKPARLEIKGEVADGLVYRGVANTRAPLRVVRDGPALIITGGGGGHIDVSQLWLTEIRSDGTTSIRVLHPFNEETAFLVKTPAQFTAEESSPDNIDVLNANLRVALRQAGLFIEEADALIETLNSAHSRRVGLRLFFLAPPKTANVSSAARIRARREDRRWPDVPSTRVVVGCIEIVTPEQRELLARIAIGGEEHSVTGIRPSPEMLTDDRWHELHEIYEWLGQFRNALILDEQRRRPGAVLQAFIQRFHLEGYAPTRRFQRTGH